MNKFKVGDKIRIKNPTSMVNGEIGIIKEARGIGWKPYLIKTESGITLGLKADDMELVQEEEKTAFEILLKHWDIEVDESFNIDKGCRNPYHFNKNGLLINCDGYYENNIYIDLITGKAKIQLKKMTIDEIEEQLKLPKGSLKIKERENK